MNKLLLSIAVLGITFGLKGQQNKIESTGNVGIGTLTPGANLEVNGTSRFSGSSSGNGIGDGYTHFPHHNGNNYIRGNTYIGTK